MTEVTEVITPDAINIDNLDPILARIVEVLSGFPVWGQWGVTGLMALAIISFAASTWANKTGTPGNDRGKLYRKIYAIIERFAQLNDKAKQTGKQAEKAKKQANQHPGLDKLDQG